MAKDGTMRGGARAGAGRPRKDLQTKILEGTAVLPVANPALSYLSVDTPDCDAFMSEKQKGKLTFDAQTYYNRVMNWLRDRSCDDVVSPLLVQQYAATYARWVQCQQAINRTGLVVSDGEESNINLYVKLEAQFAREAMQLWLQIQARVGERSVTAKVVDPMEALLDD